MQSYRIEEETKKNPSATNDLTGIPDSKCNTRSN